MSALSDDNEESSHGSQTLNGGFKFKENEFGALELVKQTYLSDLKKDSDDTEDFDLTCNEELSRCSPTSIQSSPNAVNSKYLQHQIICCKVCGSYGLAGEFFGPIACSYECYKENIPEKEFPDLENDLQVEFQHWQDELLKHDPNNSSEVYNDLYPNVMASSEGGVQELHYNSNYSWYDSKLDSFHWEKYLESTSSKSAPLKLFKQFTTDFFSSQNNDGFRVGMKLEAIDPEHPSMFCVVSVAQIQGSRLRLHFDGFSESYDFWENERSPNIFYAGWSGKTRLNPPRGFSPSNFNWKNYLMATNSIAAPERLFLRAKQTVKPEQLGWKKGMKLEAVDKQNTSLICVASVSDIFMGRILVHFDGWEADYDYWVTPNSPYIHPVGWCYEQGITLSPPNDFDEMREFHWNLYLLDSGAEPVPKSCFKPEHEISFFKKYMKLEAVDKRNPSLIRVATIKEIKRRQIKIHYDGWPENYDYWFEDDSFDIFPPGWCQKVNHHLVPPLTPEEVSYYSKIQGNCSTLGCRGIGHIKGHKFSFHHMPADCPYAPEYLNVENIIPDRLQCDKYLDKPINNGIQLNWDLCDRNKIIRNTVFNGTNGSHSLNCSNNHMDFLTEKICYLSDIRSWSSSDVIRFVLSLPGLEAERALAEKIFDEEIDGYAFLLLNQSDLVQLLGLKLGPALKVTHAIQLLRKKWSIS